MRTIKYYFHIAIFSLFTNVIFHANAQTDSTSRQMVRGFSVGIGIQSLGISEYNNIFSELGIAEAGNYNYALAISTVSLNPQTRFYHGFGINYQSTGHNKNKVGKLSYSMLKTGLEFNVGYLIMDHDRFSIPLQTGLGFSFMVFNSHTPDNNNGQSFDDLLVNGTGTGVSNFVDQSIIGLVTTGFDFKTNWFSKGSSRSYGTNIGLRVGLRGVLLNTNEQGTAGLENITGAPEIDKINVYAGIHLTKLLFR